MVTTIAIYIIISHYIEDRTNEDLAQSRCEIYIKSFYIKVVLIIQKVSAVKLEASFLYMVNYIHTYTVYIYDTAINYYNRSTS